MVFRRPAVRLHFPDFAGYLSFALLTVAGGIIAPHAARAEDKSFVSEIAKNKPGVTIVYSGEATLTAARSFANAVMADKPKQKTAANVVLTEAQKFGGAAGTDTTYVYMLIGQELGDAFPAGVRPALPPGLDSPASTLTVFNSRITSDKKNAGAFSIVLYAPDAERFARIQQDFSARRFNEDFRAMGRVNRQIKTNKLAIIVSAELRTTLAGWGQVEGDRTPSMRGAVNSTEVWNTLKYYTPAQRRSLSADELAGTAEAWFIDRSATPGATLPEAAHAALSGNTIGPGTILSARGLTEDGRTIAVFSAPTALLLKGRLSRFPNLEALPDGVLSTEAVDLRRVGPTVLLVNGDASAEEREAIRLLLAREMRRELSIVIDEGDRDISEQFSSDEALKDLYADAETLKLASQETRSPFLWTFTLTEYRGSTRYTPSETCLTAPPAPFTEPEPQAPIKTKHISDEAYAILMDDYRDKHDDWERNRRNYQDHLAMTDFQWRREVRCDETADTRGVLRLVSLADRGRVLWEHEGEGHSSNSYVYQTDTIAVQGPDARPSSLPSPPAENFAGKDIMRKAVLAAGRAVLQTLGAEAWLRDPNAPLPVYAQATGAEVQPPAKQTTGETAAPEEDNPVTAPAAPPKPPAAPPGPKVAAIHGKTVYLNIGSKQGVKVGDRFKVALSVLEIKDPDTGAVLDRKVTSGLTVRVTAISAAAECIADTPADAAQWGKLRIGQSISKLPPKTPAKLPAKPARAVKPAR